MKGQAAIEFLVYVGIVALIMAIFLWHSLSLQNQSMYIKINVEAKKFCDTIAFEINSAVRSGNGYNRKFFVDDSFYGVSNFDVLIGNYSVYVNWTDNSVSSSIITKNVTNTNTINPGFNLIENRNGDIYVTSI